jgi:DNA-binding LytR/AlgR family response regulator
VLDRIPLAKRGRLLALSVEDHYVRVRTSNGEDIVLMRLADAMRETTGADGLQVHPLALGGARSRVRRPSRGDRAVLTLVDGTEVPVSRRYVPAIRKLGFCPDS